MLKINNLACWIWRAPTPVRRSVKGQLEMTAAFGRSAIPPQAPNPLAPCRHGEECQACSLMAAALNA